MDGFAARLRTALRARRIPKLQAIAEDIGVSQSAISRWQNGGHISLESLVRLCTYLDVSADWLLLDRGHAQAHRDVTPTATEIELLMLLREHGPDAAAN